MIKYRKEGARAILKHDKLFINGQKYTETYEKNKNEETKRKRSEDGSPPDNIYLSENINKKKNSISYTDARDIANNKNKIEKYFVRQRETSTSTNDTKLRMLTQQLKNKKPLEKTMTKQSYQQWT